VQWEPLIAVVNALTSAAGILGAVVVILLLLGFFVGLRSDDDGESAAEREGGAP
jgi:hypothetical protein